MTTQTRYDPARHGPLYKFITTPAVGSIFYVNTAANGAADANDGRSPETAFLTIDYAIGQCTAGADDYIFVIDHDDGTETYPIVMDVNNVHLIGKPIGGGPMPQIRVQGDVNGITVSAQRCEIAGFYINTALQADTNILVNVIDNARFLHFHDNFVAWRWWGGDSCMTFTGAAYGGSDSLICNNYFGAHGWNATGYCITIAGGTGRLVIRENLFIQLGYQTGNHCIMLGSANHCCILNNRFVVEDAADSAIDTSGAGTVTNIIDGNVAFEGDVTPMAANPYNIQGTNHWGLNYAGIVATMPA